MELAALSHLEGCTLNKLMKSKPYCLMMKINGQEVSMELDTGSPWTIISSKTYCKVGKISDLKPCKAGLKTYTGNQVPIVGEAMVSVKHASQPAKQLPLLVVEEGVSLIGREWIENLPIALEEVLLAPSSQSHKLVSEDSIQHQLAQMVEEHAKVFDMEVPGKLKGFLAKVYPVEEKMLFYKAAPVPYTAKPKIDESLDDLLEKGVIEPVKFADYACPIVVANKPDGSIRVCGNYKITANKVLRLEQYPIPTLEDLMQDLQGGQRFSKLDLSHAYHQIELDEAARKYTTINTHRGLFQYARLPFGLASAPAIFQRTIESVLGDIPMCRPYLDDIIISGRNDKEHLANLKAVLNRLQENGMKLKKSKCEFFKESVVYLGHHLDEDGLRPLESKIKAIQEAPEPQNQEELQAYLGLLGYYRKFIPNLSKHIAPLTDLLKAEFKSTKKTSKKARRDVQRSSRTTDEPKFKWGPEQRIAFAKSKKFLQSESLLVHLDPKKPLFLQTDASPYGLGAVISHAMPDGSERPISFASRTLTPSEKNYAQYEKEGLSIIFGLKKFHKFLHGRKFTIVTDHKPLVSLFGNQKPSSPMSSARVTRWHQILSAYQYDIVHKEGKKHCNADALSRLPVGEETDDLWVYDDIAKEPTECQANLLTDVDSRPVEAQEIKSLTDKDPVLSTVRSYILRGWPSQRNLGEEFMPYSQKREELSTEDDVVMWGHRVVIPQNHALRSRLMEELHATHPGVVKMKALARSYLWWPAIDKMLEKKVQSCIVCQEHQNKPQQTPIHPWEFPEQPWLRLHIDYASIDGQDVLIVTDAHSKWIEAVRLNNATTTSTVRALRRIFATHGIPETIVSDNGTQFVSEEFYQFLTSNGVQHLQTAPKHPSSNGLAERAVQTVKCGVKKIREGDLDSRIQKFLLLYRVTPQATTGKSPSELLYRRQLRTKLDLLRPNLAKKVKMRQSQVKDSKKHKVRSLHPQDTVLVKNFAAGPTWLYGQVYQPICDSMYEVTLEDGRTVRRHVDHIRRCLPRRPQDESLKPKLDLPIEVPEFNLLPNNTEATETEVVEVEPVEPKQTLQPKENPATNATPLRISNRERKMPQRFDDYVLFKP